jgi:predicted DNA-binding ribbon-helix-helix protein
MKKYSVSLHGHATSVSLEPEFWEQVCQIADARGQSVASFISEIDDQRDPQLGTGLSGALRLFVLEALLARLEAVSADEPA